MNKFWKIITVGALTSAVLLTSCKKDEEPEPDPEMTCADYTFPTADGDASIKTLNYSSSSIEVEAGSILALAVEVTKGSSRTKKLRLFASDCENQLGTEYDLSDQPKGGKNGIDLRNTDDAQVRNVNYTIPTGMDPIYLTIQIDEGGGATNYKQLTLNVSGSGLVTLTENVELGAGGNANPSRMASATGLTYTSCDAAANIDYIDITYAVSSEAPDYTSHLCSNPARFLAPISKAASSASCGDDGDLSTAGGSASYFKVYTGDKTPSTAVDADLEALTVSSSDNQYVPVAAAGEIFEFLSPDGKKGLIEVTAIDQPNNTAGSCTVSVVVQR